VEYNRASPERHVRIAAQRILANHLREPEGEVREGSEFWPEISLDLAGALLIDLEMDGCRFHEVTFTGARFIGTADFRRAVFSATVSFSEAQFEGIALFEKAKFLDDSDFNDVTFAKFASFDKAHFARLVGFMRCHFMDQADFESVRFDEGAVFNYTEFEGRTRFVDTKFTTGCSLGDTEFKGVAIFNGSFLGSGWPFLSASFTQKPALWSVTVVEGDGSYLTNEDENDVRILRGALFPDGYELNVPSEFYLDVEEDKPGWRRIRPVKMD